MFAPHPDDETFGCGGTIAKKISEGHHVLIVIMTDGRYALFKVSGITSDPPPEQIKEIRRKELKRAVSHLGVSENNLIFLDFVDGTLAKNEEEAEEKVLKNIPSHLEMPRRIDWNAVKRAYDIKPRNYEELIEIRGIGPSTIRALALISALIYGAKIDWKDPVKFTFTVGGKDGVPYPVSRRTYDETLSFMQQVLEEAEIGGEEKKAALRRLLSLERRIYG